MKAWITVLKAADAAARWHVHQRRKGAAKEPYINHLLEVAALVAEATEGKDPNLVIAALLHDAIEGCEVPHKLIAETSGPMSPTSLRKVTDDKTLDKSERKKRQAETAHKKTGRAKFLKFADKTSNLRALALSQHRIGPCDAGSNISIGPVRSSKACVVPVCFLKSNSMPPRGLQSYPSYRRYRRNHRSPACDIKLLIDNARGEAKMSLVRSGCSGQSKLADPLPVWNLSA
jgi:hypothetical protein